MAARPVANVRHILELKRARLGEYDLVWISPDELVAEALKMMRANKVRSVLAMRDREAKPEGILTAWDIVIKLELEQRLAIWTHVRDIMTPAPLETVVLVTPLEDVVARFADHRHLPVLDGGRVIDVISDMDIVYAMQAHSWSLEDTMFGVMQART